MQHVETPKQVAMGIFLCCGGCEMPSVWARQNVAPPIEWDFSSPSTIPGFELDDNWGHSIIQASDGNFIVVGFADKYGAGETTGFRHPAIFKYNPGRSIVW